MVKLTELVEDGYFAEVENANRLYKLDLEEILRLKKEAWSRYKDRLEKAKAKHRKHRKLPDVLQTSPK